MLRRNFTLSLVAAPLTILTLFSFSEAKGAAAHMADESASVEKGAVAPKALSPRFSLCLKMRDEAGEQVTRKLTDVSNIEDILDLFEGKPKSGGFLRDTTEIQGRFIDALTWRGPLYIAEQQARLQSIGDEATQVRARNMLTSLEKIVRGISNIARGYYIQELKEVQNGAGQLPLTRRALFEEETETTADAFSPNALAIYAPYSEKMRKVIQSYSTSLCDQAKAIEDYLTPPPPPQKWSIAQEPKDPSGMGVLLQSFAPYSKTERNRLQMMSQEMRQIAHGVTSFLAAPRKAAAAGRS